MSQKKCLRLQRSGTYSSKALMWSRWHQINMQMRACAQAKRLRRAVHPTGRRRTRALALTVHAFTVGEKCRDGLAAKEAVNRNSIEFTVAALSHSAFLSRAHRVRSRLSKGCEANSKNSKPIRALCVALQRAGRWYTGAATMPPHRPWVGRRS